VDEERNVIEVFFPKGGVGGRIKKKKTQKTGKEKKNVSDSVSSFRTRAY